MKRLGFRLAGAWTRRSVRRPVRERTLSGRLTGLVSVDAAMPSSAAIADSDLPVTRVNELK
jgi:hypothetical protein